MTVQEAIDYIKNLAFEDGATTALATSAQFLDVVAKADQRVWNRMVTKAPSMGAFTVTDSSYALTAANTGVPLTTAASGSIQISSVRILREGNYILLAPMNEREAQNYTDYPSTSNFGREIGWFVKGAEIRLLPPPVGTVSLRVEHLNYTAPSSTGSTLLSTTTAWTSPYHELVAIEAAMMFALKDEAWDMLRALRETRDELFKDFERALAKNRKTQNYPGILERPFD